MVWINAFFLPRIHSIHLFQRPSSRVYDCQMAVPMDTGSLKPPTAMSTKVTGTRSPLHFHISWIRSRTAPCRDGWKMAKIHENPIFHLNEDNEGMFPYNYTVAKPKPWSTIYCALAITRHGGSAPGSPSQRGGVILALTVNIGYNSPKRWKGRVLLKQWQVFYLLVTTKCLCFVILHVFF